MARNTLDVFIDIVPREVPGIMFLSGGMTEGDATACLDQLNKLKLERAAEGGAEGALIPWNLSFSFGRALQTSALLAWAGKQENRQKAANIVASVAKANSEATRAVFQGEHPSISESGTLYENFRGWQGKASVS